VIYGKPINNAIRILCRKIDKEIKVWVEFRFMDKGDPQNP
jgi:hypothetical protein